MPSLFGAFQPHPISPPGSSIIPPAVNECFLLSTDSPILIFVLLILTSVRWYLIVALVFICLTAGEVDLSIYLLAICMSFREKCVQVLCPCIN